jgi:hypothetical protein
MTNKDSLPDWWPDWMTTPYHGFPLGKCRECGAQQYPMSHAENHMSTCPRKQLPEKVRHEVPWPRNFGR